MATVLSYRPATSGTTGSNHLNRQGSLSSFPSSGASSNPSVRNGIPQAPSSRPVERTSEVSSSRTPSTPSSLRQAGQFNGNSQAKLKRKSQYPADSAERHVEYILVASFHVDRGPIMEHQYPGAISGDEGMLAELMLPDQVHNRKEDWTMFFLHKDTSDAEGSGDEDEEESKTASGDKPDNHEDDHMENEGIRGLNLTAKGEPEDLDDAEGGEGPPLIYVLNLVNTKHDASVKRSVKSFQQCASIIL